MTIELLAITILYGIVNCYFSFADLTYPENCSRFKPDAVNITAFNLFMNEEDMVAGKFSALLTRKRFASRDLFDLWFFLNEKWQINEEFLKAKSGLSLKEALAKTQVVVQNIKPTELLAGLGELLDNKQKIWVKEKLKDELLFLLRLYQTF